MSLHRWSLSSRALAREKSDDSDPAHQGRFFTIHIGSPRSRKHTKLSSAFASFEKDENRPQATAIDADRFTSDDLQPLSTRIENVPSPVRSKYAKLNVDFHRPDTPVLLPNKRKEVAWPSLDLEETLKKPHTSSPLGDGDKGVQSSDGNLPGGVGSSTSLTRVRSASSSYPSEGIRSPPENCCSPQLNSWSENFVSELSRFRAYPSEESSSKSSVSTGDVSDIRDGVHQCLMEELAAAGGISDTDTRTTSGEYPTKPPLSDILSVASLEEEQNNLPEICHDCGLTVKTAQEVQDSTSSQDYSRPAIHGQISSTSAIYGSVPDLRSSIRVGSSENDALFRPSNVGSTDRLRPSIDTHASHSSEVHWKSQGKPYNTMPASLLRKAHTKDHLAAVISPFEEQPSSGLHFENPNGSSITIVQRIQKFKFRKWVKKVCLRTKVRFDNAIKSESSPGESSKKKSKSEKPRRSKKQSRANKSRGKPKKVSWKSPKVAKEGKRPVKHQEGSVYRFIRSLTTRKSIQLPVQDKVDNNHRRVQSCPA
ncbi:hypothetical protein F5Y04DRAFT_241216 [Hypomontagnella monticulosa]|nr:hypothetical protein F5Y04DRAFT_241216 [Hypomontagnella monticulosa]